MSEPTTADQANSRRMVRNSFGLSGCAGGKHDPSSRMGSRMRQRSRPQPMFSVHNRADRVQDQIAQEGEHPPAW